MVAFSPERFEGRELDLKGIDLQWRATSSLASPELTNSGGTGQGAVVQCFSVGWAVARAMALCWVLKC